MFSAYVVVGEPPTAGRNHRADAVGADCATHDRVEVGVGHLGHGFDVAGVLGDERDHRREHEQDERHVEARQVPADGLGTVGSNRGLRREADPVSSGDAVEVGPEAGALLAGGWVE